MTIQLVAGTHEHVRRTLIAACQAGYRHHRKRLVPISGTCNHHHATFQQTIACTLHKATSTPQIGWHCALYKFTYLVNCYGWHRTLKEATANQQRHNAKKLYVCNRMWIFLYTKQKSCYSTLNGKALTNLQYAVANTKIWPSHWQKTKIEKI